MSLAEHGVSLIVLVSCRSVSPLAASSVHPLSPGDRYPPYLYSNSSGGQ